MHYTVSVWATGDASPYVYVAKAEVIGTDEQSGVLVRQNGRVFSQKPEEVFDSLGDAKRFAARRLSELLAGVTRKFEEQIRKLENEALQEASLVG